MADKVVLAIGTRKGAFVAEASKSRGRFTLRGPFGPGVPVYSTLIDTRGTARVYASSCSPWFGMKLLRSTDLGKSFKETEESRAGVSQRRRPRARQYLGAGAGRPQEPAVVRRRAGCPLQK